MTDLFQNDAIVIPSEGVMPLQNSSLQASVRKHKPLQNTFQYKAETRRIFGSTLAFVETEKDGEPGRYLMFFPGNSAIDGAKELSSKSHRNAVEKKIGAVNTHAKELELGMIGTQPGFFTINKGSKSQKDAYYLMCDAPVAEWIEKLNLNVVTVPCDGFSTPGMMDKIREEIESYAKSPSEYVPPKHLNGIVPHDDVEENVTPRINTNGNGANGNGHNGNHAVKFPKPAAGMKKLATKQEPSAEEQAAEDAKKFKRSFIARPEGHGLSLFVPKEAGYAVKKFLQRAWDLTDEQREVLQPKLPKRPQDRLVSGTFQYLIEGDGAEQHTRINSLKENFAIETLNDGQPMPLREIQKYKANEATKRAKGSAETLKVR